MTVLSSYGALFREPGTARFSAAGFLARIPISMTSIGAVLLISGTTGSYGLAGVIVACATLGGAVVMPQLARLVDRRGQRRVTRPVVLVGGTSLALAVLAVSLDWPVWTWFLFAIVGGSFQPSVGSMVRSRWTHLLPDGELRRRAFSWESSIDEVVFILGPPLATVLATSVAPWAGLAFVVVVLIGGGFLFTAQRATEPPPSGSGNHVPRRVLLQRPLFVVAGALFTSGAAFGSIEIIVVAYAGEQGHKPLGGLILAAYAAGSLLAGLIFGVLRIRHPVGAQFVVAAVFFGLLTPLLLIAPGLLLLTFLIFGCGVSVAPVLISSTLVIEKVVPTGAITEALTWSVTCIIAGVTVGTAGAGALIDAFGARTAFAVPATAAVLGAVIALAGRRVVVRATRPAAPADDRPVAAAAEVDAPAPGVR